MVHSVAMSFGMITDSLISECLAYYCFFQPHSHAIRRRRKAASEARTSLLPREEGWTGASRIMYFYCICQVLKDAANVTPMVKFSNASFESKSWLSVCKIQGSNLVYRKGSKILADTNPQDPSN